MIFSAIGAFISGLFGGGALLASLISTGLAFGAKLLVSYLFKSKSANQSAVQGQLQIGAETPSSIVIGKCKVKGHRIYYAKWGKGNKWNADVLVLSDGWCDGLDPVVYFYGESHDLIPQTPLHNEAARYLVSGFENDLIIRFYDGRPGQDYDYELVQNTSSSDTPWKSTSKGTNLTYVVVDRKWSEDNFKDGQPEFEFILRGLRMYDPRKDDTAGGTGDHRLNDPSTWEWTQNNAIARLNYLYGIRGVESEDTLVGVGKSLSQIDVSAHVIAANVCDSERVVGSRTVPTYHFNQFITADDDHLSVLQDMEDAMAGYAADRSGLDSIIVGAPQIPVLTIAETDVRWDDRAKRRERRNVLETFNTMTGQYTSPEDNWNPQSLLPVTSASDVLEDGAKRALGKDFLQVIDPDIAQYLLTVRYRQNRYGATRTIPVTRKVGVRVRVGDWVSYQSRQWLITGWAFNERFLFTLSLAETNEDIYDEGGIVAGPVITTPSVPTNPSVVSSISGLSVEAGVLADGDGQRPALIFYWTNPDDPTITSVRIQYRIKDGDGTYYEHICWDVTAGTSTVTENVVGNSQYEARIAPVPVPSRNVLWSSWVYSIQSTGSTLTALDQLGADAYQSLLLFRSELEELRVRIETLANSTAQSVGWSINRHMASVNLANAQAEAISVLYATVDEIPTVYRQAEAPPTTVPENSIWFDADDENKVYVLVAGEWLDASAAGMTVFSQDDEPTTTVIGALWFDTDDNNRQYRWSGVSWVEVSDARIAATAAALTTVSARTNDGTAEGLVGWVATSAPSGVSARYAVQGRASTVDEFSSGGFYLDVTPTQVRVTFDVDQFIVMNGESPVAPFAIDGGVVKMQSVVLGTLTFDELHSANGKLVLKGSGTNASIEVFS